MDEDLYSRQIAAYGLNIMNKLTNIKVLIIGLRGLGIEIAKNIILSGFNEVTIYDSNIVNVRDLGTNYYLNDDNIGERRDKSCINKLKELNNYVNCRILDNEKLEESIFHFNIVIITEIMELEKIIKLNDICHQNNIGFIYCLSLGLSFFCFVDFENHLIEMLNNSELKKYFIKNIIKGEKTKIEIDSYLENFNLFKGDFIKISEIKGMNQLMNNNIKKIIKSNTNSFEIEENSINYDDYIEGGIVEEIRNPKLINFKNFKTSLEDPLIIDEFSPNNKDYNLHIAFLLLHEYYKTEKKLPDKCDNDIFLKYYENLKNINNDIIDLELIKKIYKYSFCNISSICGYGGGVVAQEIIKFTGIYEPINQWFRVEFYDILDKDNDDKQKIDSRYDEQIFIFGNEVQRKLEKLNIFMIGAGATGCELLKNFAMMGIAINENSLISVTDNDIIEKSNLNRQFLFRSKDLLKPKSEVATNAAKLMNNNIHCKSYKEIVSKETEEIFNENFWIRQDAVVIAVDNFEARRYISEKCEHYKIPYFNCGTNGTYGNFEAFLPGKTAPSYYPFNNKVVPSCTIKMFPSKISHCVQWAHYLFEKYFNDNIKDVKMLYEDKTKCYNTFDKIIDLRVRFNKYRKIFKLLKISIQNDINKCIKYSIKHFYKHYIYNINRILKMYPPDCINKKTNMKFWIGVNRIPHPLQFDLNQTICYDYIESFSYLLAKALSIDAISLLNKEYIYNYEKTLKIKDLKQKIFESKDFYELKINELKKNIDDFLINNLQKKKIIFEPIPYQKDSNDEKLLNFIFCSSNLRAKNYNIPEEKKIKIKFIAGKIIPAIATSTSSVSGLLSLQLYVICQNKDYTKFRVGCLNLSNNLLNIAIPEELKIKIKYELNNTINEIEINPSNKINELFNILGINEKEPKIIYNKKTYISENLQTFEELAIKNGDLIEIKINNN